MQNRASAFTKGPGDIQDVRKKRTFSDDVKEESPAKKATDGAWYVYACKDLIISRDGKPVVKAFKWTKFMDKNYAYRLASNARQMNVQMIVTNEPPEDVR